MKIEERIIVNPRELIAECASMKDRGRAREIIKGHTETAIAATGKGLLLSNADLRGLDLTGFDLRVAQFTRAILHGTNLSDSDLTGSSFFCAGMERTKFQRAKLKQVYLHGTAAQVCDFSHADLSDIVDATGGLFHGCNFDQAILDQSNFNGSSFYQCRFWETRLRRAKLQGVIINECSLADCDFTLANISHLTITKSNLNRAVFSGCRGSGVSIQCVGSADSLAFEDADLPQLRLVSVDGPNWKAKGLSAHEASFVNCSIPNGQFNGADLKNSQWVGSNLDHSEFQDAVIDGCTWRNCSAKYADFSRCSAENALVSASRFDNAVLSSATARGLILRDSSFVGGSFQHAYLYRAMISGDPPTAMMMLDCDFTDAVLTQAYVAADLRRANFFNAKLGYARLSDSDFTGANFAGAHVHLASLVKANMTSVVLPTLPQTFITDRTTGLLEALSAIEGPDAKAQLDLMRAMQATLSCLDEANRATPASREDAP